MSEVRLGLLALLAAGCAPTPVTVDVTFPSTETFLFSEQGQLLVYDVGADGGLGSCPQILEDIANNDFGAPLLDSGRRPICEFRDGGVGFDDVIPGPKAFVVLTFDDANTILLSGCRIGEAYEGALSIEVDLFPTDDYASATMGTTLMCGTADDKCARGCR